VFDFTGPFIAIVFCSAVGTMAVLFTRDHQRHMYMSCKITSCMRCICMEAGGAGDDSGQGRVTYVVHCGRKGRPSKDMLWCRLFIVLVESIDFRICEDWHIKIPVSFLG
jgi:hypothetical protein